MSEKIVISTNDICNGRHVLFGYNTHTYAIPTYTHSVDLNSLSY